MRVDPIDEQATLKDLVQKILELTEENLRLTRKLRRQFIWGRLFGIVKLLLLVVVPIVALIYYAKPYLVQMQNVYQQAVDLQKQVQQIGNAAGQIGNVAGQINDAQKKFQTMPNLKNIPNINQLPLDQLLKGMK